MTASLGPINAKYRHYDTPDDEVWEKWFRCPQGNLLTPPLAPALGAAMQGDTAPWGFICTETAATPDGNEASIVATYKKPKRLDAATDLSEIHRFGPRITLPNATLSGTRVYLAPDATANAEIVAHLPLYRAWSHESAATVSGTVSGGSTALVATAGHYYAHMIGRSLTIAAGSFTITAVDPTTRTITVAGDATCVAATFSIGGEPLLLWSNPQPQWRVGLTKIITQWGAPPTWHRLEQTPGHGVLEGGASMMGEKAGYDLDGFPIDMEWQVTTHHYRYEAIQGSAIVPTPTWNYKIRVALTSSGLATCKALFGLSNAAACADIGAAGAKTLWFHGFSFKQSEHASSLYHCWIDLAYYADNWDNWLKVVTKEQKAVRFQLFDTAGVDTGLKNTRAVWLPTTEPPTIESRRIIAAGNFSPINGYVA